MDFTIIGLPKCGTTSLQRYLKDQNPESQVTKLESIYDPNALPVYEQFHKGTPIIITRKPWDKLWSGYHYFSFHKRMTFEEFLDSKNPDLQNLGFAKPLEDCDWRPYAEPFKEYGFQTFTLDFKKAAEGFPHIKKTSDARGQNIPKISDEHKDLVIQRLRDIGVEWSQIC